jgi:hypothetical protein
VRSSAGADNGHDYRRRPLRGRCPSAVPPLDGLCRHAVHLRPSSGAGPASQHELRPVVQPGHRALAGPFRVLAVICLVMVMVTSIWRKQLRIRYEHWQAAHALLSTIAVVAALVHVELVHYYIASVWKRGLWAAMTAAFVGVVVWVRVVEPVTRLRRPWEVEAVTPQPARPGPLPCALLGTTASNSSLVSLVG